MVRMTEGVLYVCVCACVFFFPGIDRCMLYVYVWWADRLGQ